MITLYNTYFCHRCINFYTYASAKSLLKLECFVPLMIKKTIVIAERPWKIRLSIVKATQDLNLEYQMFRCFDTGANFFKRSYGLLLTIPF